MTAVSYKEVGGHFLKIFCPTGPGGGVDPTCSPGKGGFKGKPFNPEGADTLQQYRKPDGSWTKERQALHDEIVADVLSRSTPVSNPRSFMMGGGPASGKSVAIRSGNVTIPKNHVAIDSDELKNSIPEYKAMTKKKDPRAAAFAHEESSYLSKRIMKEASEKGYNILLDGTGDSSLESLSKKAATLKKNGKKLTANYVTVDTEVAVSRNKARAEKTGRLVPEAFVRNTHKNISKIVPEAVKRGLFDEFNLYDTNKSGDARLVASAKGTKLRIHDQELWDRFLRKGEE